MSQASQITAGSSIVLGDGWAALGLAAWLAHENVGFVWVAGSGARIVPPLPAFESGFGESGAQAWSRLAGLHGVDAGPLYEGSFTREFRNKAFREPAWLKAPTPEARREVRDEMLWEAERTVVPAFDARLELSPAEIDEQLREKVLGRARSGVRRIEGVPVRSFHSRDGKIESVTLGSGERLDCSQVFFADRWSGLGGIEGLPKGLSFIRNREPMGVLQAVFSHELPMGVGVREGFFSTLPRESTRNQDCERHVFGYFSTDGMKSFWTLFLTPDEAEDNHAITKKLRRMKSLLDRVFTGSSWLPQGKPSFLANVRSEQVRFEESILFAAGEDPRRPLTVEGMDGLFFLTDGYGPASAFRQAEAAITDSGLERQLPAGAAIVRDLSADD